MATIDSITSVPSGDPASAGVSLSEATLHFTFAIPRGNDGTPGIPGGIGATGEPGPQGPPFAGAIVDGVTTLDPGNLATVSLVFDGSDVRFTFGIPRGADGTAGPQGMPGEVTNSDLATAISGTSSNTNAVATLDASPSDPLTFADYEAMRAKLNELILALRR